MPRIGSDKVINSTMGVAHLDIVPLTDSFESLAPVLEEGEDEYDYKGALLFVVGLLSVYGVSILLLIVSLIRKSRSALEVKDHQRDFEAMRRASQKRSMRMSRENSERMNRNGGVGGGGVGAGGARLSFASRGRAYFDSLPTERLSLCKTVNEEESDEKEEKEESPLKEEKKLSYSSLRRPPLASPVISALKATEDHKAVAL